MADIAELGFRVDSDPLKRAADRLDALAPAAQKAERATDRFNHANDNARKSVDNLAAGASNLTATIARLATGLVAAFSISQLITLTNTWTDLNSRVEIASGSIGQGAAVMGRLDDMARRTYSSLELTAESYLRSAVAMRQLGYNTNETLDYVEAINNALVVSGAKGERAASVLDALGKAMALGKLSGDQLETVLASGGRVTEALADSLGVSVLALRKLGSEGKLTSDVLQRGLTSQLEKLRAEADAMPATIGDAFVLLGNSILKTVGQFSELTGASSTVAQAIISVADALSSGAISIERFLFYAGALALVMGGSWVVAFIAAEGAVGALIIGLNLLRATLIKTGIGALIILLGELLYRLYDIVDGSRDMGDAFDRLKRAGMETWERIKDGASAMGQAIMAYGYDIQSLYLKVWGNILASFVDMLKQISNATHVAIPGLVQMEEAVIRTLGASAEAHTNALTARAAAAQSLIDMVSDKSTVTTDLGDGGSFSELTTTLGAVTTGVHTMTDALTKAEVAAAKAYATVVKGANEFIAAQQLEAQTLGMSAVQANALRYAQDLLNKATEGGRTVTATQRAELVGLAQQMAATEQATKNLTEAYNFGKQTFGTFFSDFKNDLMQGTSLWDAFANAASKALGSISDRLMGMAADGLFDILFNAIGGALGGGIGGGGGHSLGGGLGGLIGHANGGYTGNAGTSQAAGIVHGQEYVLNAQATRSIGVSTLDAMNTSGQTPSNDNGGFMYQDNRSYDFSGSAMARDEIEEIMENDRRALLADMPNIIAAYNADPRKRKSA